MDQQKCIEENKIEEKNNRNNKISKNETPNIKGKGRAIKKIQPSNLSSPGHTFNKKNNAIILQKNKNNLSINKNSQNHLTEFNKLEYSSKNNASFKFGQPSLFRINEEKEEEEDAQNDLNKNLSKNNKEEKKMTLEESKGDNEFRGSKLPKWMVERFPILRELEKVPNRIEKPKFDPLIYGDLNIPGMENNQTDIMARLIEYSNRNDLPDPSYKDPLNNQKVNQNPIYTDNDNLYKRYLDEYVSRLKDFEYNTAILNRGQERKNNQEEEEMLYNLRKNMNPTNLGNKSIAAIMKTNFLGNPIKQIIEDIELNRNEKVNKNQHLQNNQYDSQSFPHFYQNLYRNNETFYSKETNFQNSSNLPSNINPLGPIKK